MIPVSRIIGIFDFDTATVENETKRFIRRAEQEGRTEYVGSGFPRSFVLMDDGSVVVSSVSPSALTGRLPRK